MDAGLFLQRPDRRPRHAVTSLRKVLGEALLQRLVEAFVRSLWKDYEDASVHIGRVSMRGAKPVAVSVDADRLWRTGELLDEYRLANVEPYQPVLVQAPSRSSLSTPSWRLLLPPIIESHGGSQTSPKAMYVLDGMHRLFNLYQRSIGHTVALTISSPHLPPPPARPHDSWEGVWRAEGDPGRGEAREARFCGLNPALFRPVSGSVDRGEWEISTVRGKQVFPTEFPSVEDCVRWAKRVLGGG